MLGREASAQNKLSNYLSVFSPSACDILGRHSTRAQMSEFGGISKTLTISRLNFIDTVLSPKTGLNKPKRSRKRAAVAMQLRPFQLPTVALLQTLRARRGKPTDFSGSLKPIFHSRWSISADVFLLIFFATIRHLSTVQALQRSLFRGRNASTCHPMASAYTWSRQADCSMRESTLPRWIIRHCWH